MHLETARTRIRPIGAMDQRFIETLHGGNDCTDYVRWCMLQAPQTERMCQPPYGDHALVDRHDGRLLGLCGLVPSLIPAIPSNPGAPFGPRFQPEVGLYYELAPAERKKGYATEAAEALVAVARDQLRVQRIVGTTTFDNEASQRVLRRLGMTLLENHTGEPPWLQVVGVLALAEDPEPPRSPS